MVNSALARDGIAAKGEGSRHSIAPRLPGFPLPLRVAIAAIGLLVAGDVIDPLPRLVWNVTDSAPRGLYLVLPGSPRVGDQVAARLSGDMEELAAQRRYLPKGIPLIKTVAAVQGDEVCALGAKVLVNARLVARRLDSDPSGRSMPWWSECRRLGAGELFLVNPAIFSFDGRYAGVTDPSLLVGKARLLWSR